MWLHCTPLHANATLISMVTGLYVYTTPSSKEILDPVSRKTPQSPPSLKLLHRLNYTYFLKPISMVTLHPFTLIKRHLFSYLGNTVLHCYTTGWLLKTYVHGYSVLLSMIKLHSIPWLHCTCFHGYIVSFSMVTLQLFPWLHCILFYGYTALIHGYCKPIFMFTLHLFPWSHSACFRGYTRLDNPKPPGPPATVHTVFPVVPPEMHAV